MNNDGGRIGIEIGIDQAQLRRDAQRVMQIFNGIGDKAEAEGSRIDNTFRNVGATIAGAFTIQQATNFVTQIVKVRGEIESLEKSFEVLAGKKGIPLFQEIKQFAVETPMGMKELAKGAQTFLSFNIAAEEVMPLLKAIGDIAMGDANKFNSLVLAFSQMRSTGKLMGQDLLQMINAGFNPLSVISEQTGKSIGKLKEEMSAGAISADMITKAFMDATSEGGKFYGMLETQSKGIQGSISNLEGAWEDALNSMGENAQGVIVGSIQAAQSLVENYEEVGKVLAEIIAVYGTYKAALIAINVTKSIATQVSKGYTIAELAQYKALVLVEKAQALLNKTILKNPYVLAAAAVAALAYGLYKYFEVENQAKKATEDHKDAVEKLNDKYAEEENHINSLVDTIRSETTARVERIAAVNELKGLYPEVFSKYIDEKGHISDLIGLQKELNEAQSQKRQLDELDSLYEAKSYLRDYKKLQTATEKGWSWASAGTSNNVNNLTEDWSFWQSKGSFLSEKISYWEKRVQEQQKVVDESSFNNFLVYLEDQTVEQLNEMKARYDKMEEFTDRELREVEAIDAELASRTPKKVVQDKAYWEDYRKKQQAQLDALTDAELSTEKAAQIRKNIAMAQAKINAYNVKNSNKETAKDTLDAEAREQKIDAYSTAVKRETEQAQFDITQTEIDALEDGYEKQSRQINLNYDRLIAENRKRKEDWLEALRDKKELEWEQENPNHKDKGIVFDRSTITEANFSEEQLSVLKMYEDIANDYKSSENHKLLKTLLENYATYEQQRTRIAGQYEEQRKQFYELDSKGDYLKDGEGNKVLKKGVTEENVTELDRQEAEALKAVDEQFAAREVTYQAWCDNITNMTLAQLLDVLEQAEAELKKVEASGQGGDKVAIARAKVAKVKDEVNKKKAKTETAPDKRSIKEWNDLREALEDCCSAFDDIGDAIGGVAGEVISTAGSIMASTLSMINGIVQLVQMSSTSMQATAAAGATAISTIEKASVILAVISAALQVAMAIANLFNNDDEKQEEIEALQGRIDQLQWEIDNADIMKLRENSINSLEQTKRVMYDVTLELIRQRIEIGNTAGVWNLLFGGVINDSEALRVATERLADAYMNVAYSANKALGEAKYKQAEEDLKKIAEQQMLIQEQIRNEEDKKKTDHGQIAEWEQKIEELGAEAIELINELVEDIIGGTSNDIAEELADAFFEAFEAGEDAAEAWGDKVNEIVADVLKRMLVQKFLEEPLGEIFDKYKSKWFKDGSFQGIDAVIESLSSFSNDLQGVGENFGEIWAALPEELKNLIAGDGADREGVKKGIATASQESVDENNARLTTMQGSLYAILQNSNENRKELAASRIYLQEIRELSQTAIDYLEEIAANTARIADTNKRLQSIENSLDDIAVKGITLKT